MSDNQADYSVGEAYFLQYFSPEFGQYSLADEELHPADRLKKPHYALTETQYYGFFVPEHNIHCFTWIWCHPNLDTVTGGTMAWQGVKPRSLACELFDYRNFMSADIFRDGFMHYKLDSGIGVKMTEPGKCFHLTYDDPSRGNSFNVVQTAVSEPLMWPTSNHFEQVMKCEGQITLRGQMYEVDCFSVRDRSFGEYRLEASIAKMPPNYWITGVFDEDFSFCIVGMDHPDHDAFWKGEFDISEEASLRFGWLIHDGKKSAVSKAVIRTDYDRQNLFVKKMSITLTDTGGRVLEIVGEVGAVTPFEAWMNARVPIALVHWTCQGKRGVGEIQSAQFTDFLCAYS